MYPELYILHENFLLWKMLFIVRFSSYVPKCSRYIVHFKSSAMYNATHYRYTDYINRLINHVYVNNNDKIAYTTVNNNDKIAYTTVRILAT